MKTGNLLQAIGFTAAAAVSVNGLTTPESNAARSLDLIRRQAGYINGTIETVAQIVSELVSVQIVGAATDQSQLRFLCSDFDYSRLQNQFYNTTLMRQIICAGSKPDTLTPLPLIRNLTSLVSTEIWIMQGIGAVQGNVDKLCDIIDVDAANRIGLGGEFVKKSVCAAADVAKQVKRSGKTLPVTLTVPQVASIAPLSEIALTFEKVTSTAKATPTAKA